MIVSGSAKEDTVTIPCISLIPNAHHVKFKHSQFIVKFCFATDNNMVYSQS